MYGIVKQLEVPTERGWNERLRNNRVYAHFQPFVYSDDTGEVANGSVSLAFQS